MKHIHLNLSAFLPLFCEHYFQQDTNPSELGTCAIEAMWFDTTDHKVYVRTYSPSTEQLITTTIDNVNIKKNNSFRLNCAEQTAEVFHALSKTLITLHTLILSGLIDPTYLTTSKSTIIEDTLGSALYGDLTHLCKINTDRANREVPTYPVVRITPAQKEPTSLTSPMTDLLINFIASLERGAKNPKNPTSSHELPVPDGVSTPQQLADTLRLRPGDEFAWNIETSPELWKVDADLKVVFLRPMTLEEIQQLRQNRTAPSSN